MNRVQTVTQKHYRVEKPGRKSSWVHEYPTGPACAHKPRARGRVVGGLAVSWPGPPAVSQLSARCRAPPASRPALRLPRAPRACAAPQRPAPQRQRLSPRPPAQRLRAPRACLSRVVGLARLYCNTAQPCLFAP